MIVLCDHAYIFDNVNNNTCDVLPFDPALGKSTKVPIVDGAVAYDCPATQRTYLLIFKNALHVPTMSHNLVPPFIMREAGIIVNDIPKIHVNQPSQQDHSIVDPDSDLKITLQLHGIFSFFHTREPTEDEIAYSPRVLLTPDSQSWDPYSDHFARNEESMVDHEGQLVEKRFRKKHCPGVYTVNSISLDAYESAVDDVIDSDDPYKEVFKGLDSTSLAADDTIEFATALLNERMNAMNGISVGASHGATPNHDCPIFEPTLEEPYVGDLPSSSPIPIEDWSHECQDKQDTQAEISAITLNQAGVTADFLSKIWHVKHDDAANAIDQSTQLCRRGKDNPLSKHYSTNDRMLRYRRLNSMFFTDTFFATKGAKSTRKNTCAQLFVSDKGYVAIYPMKSKGDYPKALKLFCKDVGVPLSLICDPSGEQTSQKVKKFAHKVGLTLRFLEESTQWANRAELYIGFFKEAVRSDLRRSNAPMALWDYCAERRALIHNVLPKELFQLNGSNPTAVTLGVQPDISNLCQYDWYDWCYYRHESNSDWPHQKESLGRVLGPFRNEGNEMAQAILQMNGTIVPRRSTRPLTLAEKNSPVEKAMRERFDQEIRRKLGDSITMPPPLDPNDAAPIEDFTTFEDDEPPLVLEEDPVTAENEALLERSVTDTLISAEVLLPQGEELKSATVIGRTKNDFGQEVGSFHNNPLLNTIIYDVQFPDGSIREYAANVIAQNMYMQVDSEGRSTLLLKSILDYSMDSTAVPMSDKYVTTKSGQKRLRQTTAGWKLLVQWRDGSEQWVPLKLLKESNPIEVAEFAVARDIKDFPAFAYWVPHVLRKRDKIISAVNSRIKRTTHKYGIEVPRTIEEAKRIDAQNNNRFWQNAIDKEMANVKVAFEILENGKSAPPGWVKSSGHLVFDVKMDFTRKARWVKDGHKTSDPEQSTYAGVVSRESVRIALTYAALNDIGVTACDIKNAYLQAPSSERHYIVCVYEFGIENVGKVALIRRALYGGKSSGADFWRHLRTCMQHLGFVSCKADGDIWMRPTQKENGQDYWEYVLLYVDDALCISERGTEVLEKEIGKYFYIKEGTVGPPNIYLGNKVSKVVLENGVEAWSFSSSQYVQAAVNNVEEYLKGKGRSLPKKVTSPLKRDYRPELDITPELNVSDAAYYQSLVGVLRWIVELGRVDITTEASMMASCMALPRSGHLEQVLHIFGYLKAHHNSEMVFDPSEPDIDDAHFVKEDWSASVYGNTNEVLPSNMPEVRGHGFKMRMYVDSDHAGHSITRRSRTGFIVYLNSSPIYWSSKRQSSIQTSSFGSEFIAMKEGCEYVRGLRYKLRMMGIACEFPTYIYGDNKSVLVNSSVPTSTLKKKSCSIAYHFVREGTASDEWRVEYIPTDMNVADLLTKPIPSGSKRSRFVKMILHHVE